LEGILQGCRFWLGISREKYNSFYLACGLERESEIAVVGEAFKRRPRARVVMRTGNKLEAFDRWHGDDCFFLFVAADAQRDIQGDKEVFLHVLFHLSYFLSHGECHALGEL